MQNNNEFYKHTDGTTYDYGKLHTVDGKNFDITVILNTNPNDFLDDDTDDDSPLRIIDFYYGDPDNRYTKKSVEQFIEKQNKLKQTYEFLKNVKQLYTDCDLDSSVVDEHLEIIKTLIVPLY